MRSFFSPAESPASPPSRLALALIALPPLAAGFAILAIAGLGTPIRSLHAASIALAAVIAMIGAVVAEFIGASEGLGVLIRQLSFQLEIAASFAVLIVLSLLGLVFYGATSLLEAKVVYWRGRT